MAYSQITGEITKVSGLKSYKVTVVSRKVHKKFKKIVSSTTSYIAHSENNHEVGEKVSIMPSTRRLSKTKNFVIVESKNKVSKK